LLNSFCDASAFANAEASFNSKIRKTLRVEYIIKKNKLQLIETTQQMKKFNLKQFIGCFDQLEN